jgi:hypothetical protein
MPEGGTAVLGELARRRIDEHTPPDFMLQVGSHRN